MSAKMIGLVAHPYKKGAAALAVALREEFTRRDVSILFDTATALLLGDAGAGHEIASLGEKCDLILVLGGDGTILSTVRALGEICDRSSASTWARWDF